MTSLLFTMKAASLRKLAISLDTSDTMDAPRDLFLSFSASLEELCVDQIGHLQPALAQFLASDPPRLETLQIANWEAVSEAFRSVLGGASGCRMLQKIVVTGYWPEDVSAVILEKLAYGRHRDQRGPLKIVYDGSHARGFLQAGDWKGWGVSVMWSY